MPAKRVEEAKWSKKNEKLSACQGHVLKKTIILRERKQILLRVIKKGKNP